MTDLLKPMAQIVEEYMAKQNGMVDHDALSKAVRAKRGNRTLREIAPQTGVGFCTLSRVENGKSPDLESFARICQWLQLSPEIFLHYYQDDV